MRAMQAAFSKVKLALQVVCPYCMEPAEKVTGEAIYPHRPDLYNKMFYQCEDCEAYVGCHPGTDKPLGRLANAQLRRAKSAAHAVFDPIWKNGSKQRGEAYAWLAAQLSIDKNDCHIGMFDVGTCQRVIEICNGFSHA